jgi:hypothetical protein
VRWLGKRKKKGEEDRLRKMGRAKSEKWKEEE